MPLSIVRDNIVHMKTDAIVNAANTDLLPGGGVCGSIFDTAGYSDLLKACVKIGNCKTGNAVITKGFKLPAKYIIHTAGPIWNGGGHGEEDLLRSCYRASLKLAAEYKLESISFPLISSGIYGYPKDEALFVAVSEISKFLMNNEMQVYIVVYDRNSFKISSNLFSSVSSFIDDNYVASREFLPHLYNDRAFQRPPVKEDKCFNTVLPSASADRSLNDVMSQLEETFSEALLRLIDEKGRKDVDVYKKANVDRRLFSKIRSNKYYKPSKETAAAFAIALELSLDETKDLLAKAGFAITHSSKFDIIIEYFVKNKQYDIFEINEALFAFDEKLLGV